MPAWFTGLTQIGSKDKEALRRRTRLFQTIQKLAKSKNETMETLIETLMATYQGMSVNAISSALRPATTNTTTNGAPSLEDEDEDDD